MHFSTFAAAVLLPFAACRDVSIPAGGADCLPTCFGLTCLGAGAMFLGTPGDASCTTLESWGCDCANCDCEDTPDEIENLPEDYSCGEFGDTGLTCDDMAYYGYGCHSMETRRATDCSGCLCDEGLFPDYVKGDGSCPSTCGGGTCDDESARSGHSCEALESFDTIFGCDCSGCECADPATGFPEIAYSGMDCNGNWYWFHVSLGDETCGEEAATITYPMGNPDDGYEERTWFTCLSCPELECDMGDCGEDACGRDGSTCALPLEELCADEDSVHTPTQWGRMHFCPEGWDATEEATEAATEVATEAVVATDEDGSFALTTTAVVAIALLLC